MTKPRSQLISYSDTPYYSITSRCVRRAFLCGEDPLTQKSYEHRRQWIEDRMRLLSSLFSIEICAFAILSNHMHIILKAVPEEASEWSDRDVIQRWLSIFRGPLIANQYLAGGEITQAEKETLSSLINLWRNRLTDISWFMKCLNEPIARQANKEDKCTGHFWESRFHSNALLTEEAVLTAMVYVDLNPVRAAIAKTPEESDHTSIKERLNPTFDLEAAVKSYCEHGGFSEQFLAQVNPICVRPLAEFAGAETECIQASGVQFHFNDYMELIDFTGRAIVENKTGHIDNKLPSILQRLSINHKTWFENALNFEALYFKRFAPRFLMSG